MSECHHGKKHHNFINTLFAYRRQISKIFRELKGLYFIDHLSVDIIDPQENIMSFSTTPAINYNLIHEELWSFDRTLSPIFYDFHNDYSWDETYPTFIKTRLQKIKQQDYGYHYGLCLVRKIPPYVLIYSFATETENIDHKYYFSQNYNELLTIGDYFFKKIRQFYISETDNDIPRITSFIPFGEDKPSYEVWMTLGDEKLYRH